MVTTRTFAAVVATLALAAFRPAAAGAAEELFTLTDGRTFVGEYDAAANQLRTHIGAKEVAIAVAPEQIAERAPFDPKKAAKLTPALTAKTVVAKPKADPNAMTPDEKARAELGFARATKLREADEVEGSAKKLERDAVSAREQAKRSKEQAERNGRKFMLRAREEGVACGEPEVYQTF